MAERSNEDDTDSDDDVDDGGVGVDTGDDEASVGSVAGSFVATVAGTVAAGTDPPGVAAAWVGAVVVAATIAEVTVAELADGSEPPEAHAASAATSATGTDERFTPTHTPPQTKPVTVQSHITRSAHSGLMDRP